METRPSLDDRLLDGLTEAQRRAVAHARGPLLVIAGAGTGKTTVITRRIAWLIANRRAEPEQILALTFTEKAAAEMEERVDVLVPYGYTSIEIATFHAFGDRFLREHALEAGLSPDVRVLSKAEQVVFLREHLFELPLSRLRPLQDPVKFLDAFVTLIARAKDEAVSPEEFLSYAASAPCAAGGTTEEAATHGAVVTELAEGYAAYQRLMRESHALDFGDQVLLTIQVLEAHPELCRRLRQRYRYLLVDEFQDTNFAQFRLLQLLAPPDADVMVVADDDQSIYKWRGAAISNVLKFLETHRRAERVVLTENFRSTQPILDAAYRLIRFNDPDRLEVKEGIDKRLTAVGRPEGPPPQLKVFDTVSSEADWVAARIREEVAPGRRVPGDVAILVRSNKEADPFLRALNVAGVPWQFSGASGLFAQEHAKWLMSCLKTLADPEDSLSWYHVLSSPLYHVPMADLTACVSQAERQRISLRVVLERWRRGEAGSPEVSEPARAVLERFLDDRARLVELSRTLSPGQLLYRWLTDTGWLKARCAMERAEDVEELRLTAAFFEHLHRFERLIGNRLPELIRSLASFQALGDAPAEELDPMSPEKVKVLTLHKAKGLEFPVVFMVGLVQGRFPTPKRRDALELPEALIKDVLPGGDYHLQEERRLFYVGATRAKDELYLTAAYDYGGRMARKLSQFVLEMLDLASPSPRADAPGTLARIQRAQAPRERVVPPPAHRPKADSCAFGASAGGGMRLDPHGADDYLTCPLKFRFSHVLRIPIMRHHAVIYGSALHKAVELFFRRRLAGSEMSEDELLGAFAQAWISEGFLTKEHEALRLAQGRQTLRRFFARQQQAPERPSLIEEKFSFTLEDITITGRWDRVDCRGEEAVIIDYKSADVSEQSQADRRAKESLQMAVYALAWSTLRGRPPERVEVRFLETGLTGRAVFDEDDFEATRQKLREAAQGIRAHDFRPQPQEFICRWCAYQNICPSATI